MVSGFRDVVAATKLEHHRVYSIVVYHYQTLTSWDRVCATFLCDVPQLHNQTQGLKPRLLEVSTIPFLSIMVSADSTPTAFAAHFDAMKWKLCMLRNHAGPAVKLGVRAFAAPVKCFLHCSEGVRLGRYAGRARSSAQSASLPSEKLIKILVTQGDPIFERLVLSV